MTVRAFTSGYDLFHPRRTVIWHDYIRESGIKHWEDHTVEKRTKMDWSQQDLFSKNRVMQLLSGQRIHGFNLGTERTLQEYEAYAGISLTKRRVHDYTLRSEEPPNPPMESNWGTQTVTWMVRIAVPVQSLETDSIGDSSLWYLGIHDEYGNEIYRGDLTRAEVQNLPKGQPEIILICEFQSVTIPAAWTVWPVTHSRGWLNPLRGKLEAQDFTAVLEELPASDAFSSHTD